MIRCYVTDRRQGNLLSHVTRAVRDGVDFIQVREKDLDAKTLFELVTQVRDVAAGTSTKVLVNDRLDVAIAAGVDGVHLPGNGLPAERVRPAVRILGCSVHSLEEAVRSESAKADFVIYGPIFETPGKAAVGLRALHQVAEAVRIPVLAIGGMTLENANAALQAGAAGIAAIRMFQRD
jgi:thiamine-phosphate pyrophosphorylase